MGKRKSEGDKGNVGESLLKTFILRYNNKKALLGGWKLNKKLQVFISSTYTDLIEERQAAVQAVLDAGHIPAGMELFKAGNASQLETIYKWIDNSDVYMLILGGRYGSIEEKTGKSYTQLEYEYAIGKGLPIFSVVLRNDFIKKKSELLGEECTVENANVSKYNDFKDLVMSKIVREVSDCKDIMLAIHTTLKDFMEEYEFVGWVRSNDTELNADLLNQLNDMNKAISTLKEEKNRLKLELDNLKQNFESNLAFEGDVIEIVGTYNQENGYRNGMRQYTTKTISREITWDSMFILWAPRLFTTLNVTTAQKELERALKDYMGRYFDMNDNLFQTIKIQYHALGLIKAYEARTTSGGTSEFIKLTEKGKNYLITKSAIIKS